MVKNYSVSERGNPLPPHGLIFPINSRDSSIMHHPTDRITHITAFVTPVVEDWLEREIALPAKINLCDRVYPFFL